MKGWKCDQPAFIMGWKAKTVHFSQRVVLGIWHLHWAYCGHIGGRWSLGSLIWMKGLRLGPDTLWLTPRRGGLLHPHRGYPLGITR